ncbi:MAG: hypothetical protein ABSE08_13390 [Syntrophobacteraceae bacterium]|jgi:hypothetical protein
MKKTEIVPALMEHAAHIASQMRRADREEVAACGKGPLAAISDCLITAAAAWTGLVDDEPVCMFGVSPSINFLNGVGIPWLLGTDKIRENALAFLRRNKTYVGLMLDIFPRLINFVDVRNHLGILWLVWLGFRIDNSRTVDVGGFPFYRFEMERPQSNRSQGRIVAHGPRQMIFGRFYEAKEKRNGA